MESIRLDGWLGGKGIPCVTDLSTILLATQLSRLAGITSTTARLVTKLEERQQGIP